MASKRKNSLVNNINRRKRAGKSRAKSRSTVSKKSYDQMEKGWPSSRNKQAAGQRKTSRRKTTTRKTATLKTAKRKTAKKK